MWTTGGSYDEVSDGNNISNWVRNYAYDSLTKNVSAFCPCLKNLPEAKLKSSGLASLAEEISRQPNNNH